MILNNHWYSLPKRDCLCFRIKIESVSQGTKYCVTCIYWQHHEIQSWNIHSSNIHWPFHLREGDLINREVRHNGYYGDKEIDFIGEKNGEKLYIQVALKIDRQDSRKRIWKPAKDTGQLSQNSGNRRYIQRKQLRGYTPLSHTPVLNGVNHTIYEK